MRLLEFRPLKTTTVIGPSICPMPHRCFVKALFPRICTVMTRANCKAESHLKCVSFNYALSKSKVKFERTRRISVSLYVAIFKKILCTQKEREKERKRRRLILLILYRLYPRNVRLLKDKTSYISGKWNLQNDVLHHE